MMNFDLAVNCDGCIGLATWTCTLTQFTKKILKLQQIPQNISRNGQVGQGTANIDKKLLSCLGNFDCSGGGDNRAIQEKKKQGC